MFQDRNFSYENIDPFTSDIVPAKDDSLHLDPLVNPRQAGFKTKNPEEKIPDTTNGNNSNKFIPPMENWHQKRKGLGTVKQKKRKALKLKEKTDTIVKFFSFSDPEVQEY